MMKTALVDVTKRLILTQRAVEHDKFLLEFLNVEKILKLSDTFSFRTAISPKIPSQPCIISKTKTLRRLIRSTTRLTQISRCSHERHLALISLQPTKRYRDDNLHRRLFTLITKGALSFIQNLIVRCSSQNCFEKKLKSNQLTRTSVN